MARSWRYIGSGAVMISELVDGSACTKPPVDGPLDGVTGEVAWGELVVLAAPIGVCGAVPVWLDELPLDDAEAPPLYAARSKEVTSLWRLGAA